MAYTPIISQEENVVIVKCATCRGSLMNFIERFASEADMEDVENYRQHGCSISTLPVRRLGLQVECTCNAPAAPPAKPAVSSRPKVAPTGKPLLRMPKKA